MLNEIPVEYFCNLDHNGRRKDIDERPELTRGTVEYVAPAGGTGSHGMDVTVLGWGTNPLHTFSTPEYMVRPPMPPVFFFAIDVTHAASSSGALAATCRAIRSCLDSLPGDERTRVRGWGGDYHRPMLLCPEWPRSNVIACWRE